MAGAHTTFTNGVTLTDAGWFQDVDTVAYTLFGNGTSYTGVLTLAGTTQSTSTSTGQAIISGGMGLAKNLWVGGTGNFAGAVTLQAALTYGGVTLSNAVTGTGNMVLSAAPTFSGTVTSGGDVVVGSGYGTTPTTGANYKNIYVGGGALQGNTTNGSVFLIANLDGAGNAIYTGGASYYQQSAGAHQWFSITSTTAGVAPTLTQKMILDTNGSLQANANASAGASHRFNMAATSNYAMLINNSSATPYGLQVYYDTSANNTTSYFFICNDVNNTRMAVLSNGNVLNINNSYGATSDRKLKQDISLAGSQLNDVLALSKVVSKFRRKTDPTGPLQLGFIAQDVQKIAPGLVDETEDLDKDNNPTGEKTLSVKYSIAYMKAFKALGEVIERLQILEAKCL